MLLKVFYQVLQTFIPLSPSSSCQGNGATCDPRLTSTRSRLHTVPCILPAIEYKKIQNKNMEPVGPHQDMSKSDSEIEAHSDTTLINAKQPHITSSSNLESKILSNVQLDKECAKSGSSIAISGLPFSKPAVIGLPGEQEHGNPDYKD